jgi:predicted regulator of Ras-like GTPase activity (Roadblock/LC7/MglB family)
MISEQVRHNLTARLKKLLDDCDVIDAGVVATIDGHMCAMYARGQFPLERLATMGSSLMALGDTITAELSMGGCDKIISENQDGIVAFMHIGHDFVLITLTRQKHGLGMLLSYSRSCAQEMISLVGA